MIEHDFRTDLGRDRFDLQLLSGGDLVLLAAGLDDCIHSGRAHSGPGLAGRVKPTFRGFGNERRGLGRAFHRVAL